MTAREWFKDAKYGMMIHWGLYSILGGEWKGERMTEIAEWCQQYFRIPNEEYEKLAAIFNPIYFDAEEWVLLAKAAGMKYLVFTTKHHEGFAMYHSHVSSYNIVDSTPFGRDVLAELAAACKKHGMKLGIYYSQELDWHEANGGGYNEGKTWCGGKGYWTNNWDYPEDHAKNYTQCFEDKIKPQVKELLTNYGELCLIWFDTPGVITKEQSKELYDLVKQYQPNCLINSRIGNGMGDYTSAEDNEIPEDDKGDMLFETPATLNDTWGYKYFDDRWKSAEEVRRIRTHLNSRGINYLLNVGPDALGRIPAPAIRILLDAATRQ